MKIRHAVLPAAILFSMSALAEEPVTFSSLDADRDGVLNEQEVQASDELAETFSTADQNQDGSLDQAEFSLAMAKIQSEAQSGQKS